MTRLGRLVPVLALLATAAATAAAPAPKTTPAAAPAPKPRLVCFTEPSTGSHIRKRTCMSESEAAERRKRDQEAMTNMRQRTSPQAPPPGN